MAGVYMIVFDNGLFYIGSSGHIRDRFHSWTYVFIKGISNSKNIGNRFFEKVKECKTAIFSVVEYFDEGNRDDLYKKEEAVLSLYKGNPMLINSILHPKNPIIQYTRDWVEVKRFSSLQGAAKELGFYTRAIQDVVNEVKKTTHGFRFKLENPEAIRRKQAKIKPLRPPKQITILRCSLGGDVIDGFTSIVSAAKASGVNKKGVYKVLKGLQNKSGGYIFRYA